MFGMRSIVGACALLGLTACSAIEPMEIPGPRLARAESLSTAEQSGGETTALPGDQQGTSTLPNSTSIQVLEVPKREIVLSSSKGLDQRFSDTDSIEVAVEGMIAKDFVNYVFGELLKAQYVIVEGVAGLDQGVSFNSQGKITSRKLYRVTAELLATRGLGVTAREGVFFIGPIDPKGPDGTVIGYGREAENVPDTPARILQIVPFRYGMPNPSIDRTLGALVDVQYVLDFKQNAMFLTGSRSGILRALDVIRLLDQPAVRSNTVAALNLVYLSGREFVEQVVPLLANEGITAGTSAGGSAESSAVVFVPLDRLGSVVVFAANDALLNRVEFWSRQLDRPGQGPEERYFIYQPKFARATDIGESLVPMLGGVLPSSQNPQGNNSRDTRSAVSSGAQSGSSAAAGPVSVQGQGVSLTVDARSNSLVFFTTGTRYEALLPMVKRLDVPPKQVLLEAMIAEVSLSGEFANGVEFALTDGKLSGGTIGQLGLPGGGLGLTYVANLTDQVRLRLKSSNSKVNVLSSPVLVVRDGVAASITVGNQVPTAGTTTSDPIQSERTVTTVNYRDTGVALTIVPTINAQGLVVMTISQSISNAVPGSSGIAGAPIFFTRTVNTEVVASSGQSVLLAGLISETGSESSDGVPVLSRLPALGAFFRSDAKRREKTELLLLITPRVLDTPEEWDSVRRTLNDAVRLVKIPGDREPEPVAK
jgi:general secretion pathway protein D